jgi:hypothetical protein
VLKVRKDLVDSIIFRTFALSKQKQSIMEVTKRGYYVREAWDCDGCQPSIIVYNDVEEQEYLGELYGYSLEQFENEDGSIDFDELDDLIEREFY